MNNTKQKILNSCHNLFEKKIINQSQLKDCLAIESGKIKKKTYDEKTENIINSKNLEYTNIVKNLKKKYKTYYNQYNNNRINSIKYPNNCLFKKRSDIFKNNLYKLNLDIRKHISNVTNNYKDNKYDNQYTELISLYKDIEANQKDIDQYEKKLEDIIEKKNIYIKNQNDFRYYINFYNIINLIFFIITSLVIFITYKIVIKYISIENTKIDVVNNKS